MTSELTFSLISTLLYLAGVLPYWRDVFRGRTIPHPFSSFVWLVLTGFNTYILLFSSEFFASIPGIITCIFLTLGIIFGLRDFQKIRINWFDYLCLMFAIIFILYYLYSRNTTNAVILSGIIDFLAFLPTFKKGWLQPWTETILLYLMASVSNIFALLALTNPDFDTIAFWLYLVIANLAFFCMVFFRRWYLRGWKSIFE